MTFSSCPANVGVLPASDATTNMNITETRSLMGLMERMYISDTQPQAQKYYCRRSEVKRRQQKKLVKISPFLSGFLRREDVPILHPSTLVQ